MRTRIQKPQSMRDYGSTPKMNHHDNIAVMQERLALMSEAVSGVLYDLDVERGTTLRSKGLFDLLGFPANRVSKSVNWWNDRIHPLDRERVCRAFESSKAHCEVEYRVKHRNGTYIHIWDRALILRDGSGRVKRIVGNNLDISRHKDIERILRTSYQSERMAREAAEERTRHALRFQQITNAFSLAIRTEQIADIILAELLSGLDAQRGALFEYSKDLQILTCVKSYGYTMRSRESLVNIPIGSESPFCEAVIKASPTTLSERFSHAKQYPDYLTLLGKSWHGEILTIPLQLGSSVLGVIGIEFKHSKTVSDDERNFLRVVTFACAQAFERARLYEAELAAREEAEAASRAKDEFFAVVSHELRSPLQSILGWIRLARTSKLDAAMSARALEIIEQNTRSQVQLVSDMLEASRIVTGKVSMDPTALSIDGLIESSVDQIRPTAENKGVELRFKKIGKLPRIWGDVNRLQQVFWNLFSNAIKFTPKGGIIEITLASDKDNVIITVKDSGEGIVPEFLTRIFDRFAQADQSKTRLHGGIGLGLAIVRHIVELHGGQVAAESAGAGKGALFKVSLPVRTPAHGNSPNVAKPSNATRVLEGIKVLVIEDSSDTREFLMTALQIVGAQVTCAPTAQVALDMLEVFEPSVILSDIGLPDQDGYALMKKIRAKFDARNLPAIALTGYASAEDLKRSADSGFQLHLPKPVDPDELTNALVRLTSHVE